MPVRDRTSPSGPEIGNPWIVQTAAELSTIIDVTGAKAYIVSLDKWVTLYQNDATTVDNLTVFNGSIGTDRWKFTEERIIDPVRVRQLSDLPTPVGGVITLAANTRYEFIGLVDIGANSLQLSVGTGIEGRDGIIRHGASPNYLLTMPATGMVRIQNITLQSNGLGCITTAGAATLEATNVTFENAPGFTGGYGVSAITSTGGNIELQGCKFRQTLGQGFRTIATVLNDVSAQACVFETATGMYVDAASTLDSWVVDGCVFKSTAIGAGLHDAGGTIAHAQSTNNDFSQCARDAYNNVAQATFSPIEVRSPTELGIWNNATQRTLVADVKYEVIGLVYLNDIAIIMADGNEMYGRGGTLRGGAVGTYVLTAPGAGSVYFHDLHLESTTGIGIFTSTGECSVRAENCTFERTGVPYTGTWGLYFNGSSNGFIELTGCRFVGMQHAIWLTAGSGLDSLMVKSCSFDNESGITIGNTATLTDFMITGCNFTSTDTGYGIQFQGTPVITYHLLSNNDFRGCTRNAMDANAQTGLSPIEVRTQVELGVYVSATQRNLVANVTYEIIGTLNLAANNYFIVNANNILRGRGGRIVANNNVCIQIEAATTGNVAIEDLVLQSAAGFACVAASNSTADIVLSRCTFLGPTGAQCFLADGTVSGDLSMYDCKFIQADDAASFNIVLGSFTNLIFMGCIFGIGYGISIVNNVVNISIIGCTFQTSAGRVGITDGSVTAGRIVGNIFTGAGTPTLNVTAPNGWAARGNIGVADF